jgi:hypothetical protein
MRSRIARSVARATVPRFASLATLAALVLAAGCSQVEPVEPVEPVTDPTQLYTGFRFNYAAINLAADSTVPAHNEVQLVVTPYNGAGQPIENAPAATFSVPPTDTGFIRVTDGGLIHAKAAANNARVIATLAIGEVRYTDTALVKVTATAPAVMLDTLSIQVDPEIAKWYVPSPYGGFAGLIGQFAGTLAPLQLVARAAAADGSPLSGLKVEYSSLNPTVATVQRNTGVVTPLKVGHVSVVARTYAYGVERADNMAYIVNPPYEATFNTDSVAQAFIRSFNDKDTALAVPTVTISAGGIVSWRNEWSTPVDITFDDPTNVASPPAAFCDWITNNFMPGSYCGTGNVDPFTSTWFLDIRFRYFPNPGTYQFHSTALGGAAGKIVVVEATAP